MADIDELFGGFDEPLGFDEGEAANPVVVEDEEEQQNEWVVMKTCEKISANWFDGLFFFRSTLSKSEKRPHEEESAETEGDEKRKKRRTEDSTKVTESILDDIRLEDIESRITVHVIESPESCTHEVAVYPGKIIAEHFESLFKNF